MKKLILSLLKSAVGKAIITLVIDSFLTSLRKRGYYMTASSADAQKSQGGHYGNILNAEAYRKAMVSEFVEFELENVKP